MTVIPSAFSRSDSASVGASATLVVSVISMGIGMVLNVVVARALGPELKGQIDLMNATLGLATMIVGLSMTSGIIYFAAQNQGLPSRLAWQLLEVAIIQGGAVWLGLAILSHTQIGTAFIPENYTSWGAAAVALTVFASLLGMYGRAFLSGLQQFVKGAALDFLARLLTATATIVALICFGANHELTAIAVIIGSIVAVYVVTVATIAMSLPRLVRTSTAGFLQTLKYSLHSYAANFAQFANYRLDVFLVAYFVGVRGVALYGIAVSIAQLLWLPPNAMQSVLFPRFSAMTNDHQKAEEAAQMMRLVLFFTAFAVGTLAVAAPWLINVILGVRFLPSLLPLRLLLPGIATFCVAKILSSYLGAIGKPQLNFMASLIGLVATLVIDFALIPSMGIVGAAIASSVSYSISAAVILYYFTRESRLSIARVFRANMDDVQLALRILCQVWEKIFLRFKPR